MWKPNDSNEREREKKRNRRYVANRIKWLTIVKQGWIGFWMRNVNLKRTKKLCWWNQWNVYSTEALKQFFSCSKFIFLPSYHGNWRIPIAFVEQQFIISDFEVSKFVSLMTPTLDFISSIFDLKNNSKAWCCLQFSKMKKKNKNHMVLKIWTWHTIKICFKANDSPASSR